jgi:hypothetical protein
MVILDLIKATCVCGGTSFLVYTFPVIGQALTICILALLWLLYARQTVTQLRKH